MAPNIPPSKPYQKHVFAHSTVFPAENDGVYSFADTNGDGTQDLVYIKTRNTSTGKVEIHVADYESKFQKSTITIRTVFDIDDNGTYLMQDQNGDGKADLVYIKTRNTAAKTVELHVADAASGYQKLAFQTDIYSGSYEENAVWTMSSKGDLVYINFGDYGFNPRMIQCLVFTKESDYRQRLQNTLPRLDTDDSGTWCIAPTCDSVCPNLYYIKPMNPWTGKVEVHVDYETHGSSQLTNRGWKSHAIELPPSLTPKENGRWLMVNFTHQEQPDLAFIKTKNTVSGRVEVLITSPQEVVPQSYIHSSRNVRLEPKAPNVLRAELKRNDNSWRDASINLDTFLGNIDGVFTWDKKGFHESARQISLDGSLVNAELRKKDGSWVPASFDLQDKLMNNNGVFRAIDVPVFLGIPSEHFDDFLSHLSAAMDDPNFEIRQVVGPSDVAVISPELAAKIAEGARLRPTDIPTGVFPDNISVMIPQELMDTETAKVIEGKRPIGPFPIPTDPLPNPFPLPIDPFSNFGMHPPGMMAANSPGGNATVGDLPDVHINATTDPDGVTVFHANAGVNSGGVIFKTYTAQAKASVIHIGQSKGRPIKQVNVDVLSIDTSTTVGTYVGADANVSLLKAEASMFQVQLGVGVDTGIGIKDDSLSAKVGGFGFSVGRVMSIEVFGSSFGVDFGKVKDEIVDAAETVGHEIEKAAETVGREVKKSVDTFLGWFGL
ncbi:hypothetical protein F5H01DRAFT_348987 [Linnemannia elongata]|nr:hypothetical protein F5H01DRAFT_348987 [Linnemannia elongata]